MTVDQERDAWDATPTDAIGSARGDRQRPALGGLAISVLRLTAVLVVVSLAILVLFPAMLAAQPTFLG